jgi:hypothetical protein
VSIGHSPTDRPGQSCTSSATVAITSASSTVSRHAAGIASTPQAARSRLPVIAPMESESPLWLTASSTPWRKSRATSAH